MLRVGDMQRSVRFYTEVLGMKVLRTTDRPEQKYSLAFVGYDEESRTAVLELTYNYDDEDYGGARNFGHLAFEVDDIHAACERLQAHGVTINRPPRDGRMAFVRSPDAISIELLQKGEALPPREPWLSMPNTGAW